MLNFNKIKCYPIKERKNKFKLEDMLPLDSDIIENREIEELAARIVKAKKIGAKVIIMIGGAVIKTGCSRILIDLIDRGIIDHIAMNGGASIHDFEISMIGETSENVKNGLEHGNFGMAQETLVYMNEAINSGYKNNIGYGEAIGRKIGEMDFPYKKDNVLYNALKKGKKATVHIAIGGDIIHQHPTCNGESLGKTSYIDFQKLAETISQLKNGVILNIGSAVNLPEVFLKALTITRNLEYDVRDFTTANFDFLDMFRPRTRLIEWPKVLGCKGYDIRGDHVKTVPALYQHILKLS